MQTILSTKKLSEKNKVKLENAGFLVVEKNFIKTKSVAFSIEDTNKNLIFTSKNAVKSILPFKKELITKSIFCVGSNTKKFLEKNGFSVLEVIQECEKVLGKRAEVNPSPRRPGDPDSLVASSQKAREILGWRPRYPQLKDMIGSAWTWHQKNPEGYRSSH